MKTKTITLSMEMWEEILNATESYWDRGPAGEGWQSDELSRASATLQEQLKMAIEVERNNPKGEAR